MRGTSLILTLLLLGASFSGCFGKEDSPSENISTSYPSIYDRHLLEWNSTGSYSLVLEPGPHTALPVQEALIPVDTSQVWETGPASAEVHLSYWLPSNTEIGDKVPVIAVISPYFS